MDKENILVLQLLLLLFLILICGIFSCIEVAVISVNKNKLLQMSEAGNRKAKRLLSITDQLSKFFATIQIGNTIAGFLASAFAAIGITDKLTSWFFSWGTAIPIETLSTISVVIITIILSFFQMVLGELVPKRIGIKKAEPIAFALSGLILLISKVFAPVVWLLTKSTNGTLRILGINPEADNHSVTEEEILMMIDVSSSKGTIQEGEKEILHNVFEFDNKVAGEVMTHRRDTVMLKLEDSDEEWEKTIMENNFSFFPVCDKSSDNIVGVLQSRDYLCLSDHSRETVMAQAVEPAQFVPNSVRNDKLFRKMKKSRNHFAVVIDEHGGMMGIVTMKDLLEELVGNLDDDNSMPPEEPLIVKSKPETWILNGAISLDKAAQELGLELPVEKYDTFAGFVFSLLGRIPEDGNQTELETHGLKIKILEIRERRLEKAVVTKLSK